MKLKSLFSILLLGAMCVAPFKASAQIDANKAFRLISAVGKTAQALTITDNQMAAYVKQSVETMDKENQVLPESNQYVIRLRRLTKGITDADGIPLNFKVYKVDDINAFACPDGSVRVYSALMDIMNDDELMGVIGHEIGHVMKRHSKKALKQQLLTDAAFTAVGAANDKVARLTDSQIGAISQTLMSAKFSQKQENEADDCGYEFLVAHGINPWGMTMAFEKFAGMENGIRSSMLQKMFSSHPDTQKRIKRMSSRATKDGFKRPTAK